MADTVAQMLVTAAVTAVRSATAHDNDQQVTDAQITAELDREYRRVRRWVSSFLPELYQYQAAPVVLSGAQSGATISKPVDYDRLMRIERQYPTDTWYPLEMRASNNQYMGVKVDVSGTYRICYIKRPVDGYTAFDVPDGCEDLIILPVCAWVANRHNDDGSYFLGKCEMLKREVRADLSFRYGSHGRSALQLNPIWGPRTSFFEEGDHFVIV